MDLTEAMSGGTGGFWLFAVPVLTRRLSFEDQEATGISVVMVGVICAFILLLFWAGPGGAAWALHRGRRAIPGPKGYPIIGSLLEMGGLAHMRLAKLAREFKAEPLMALSLGNTRLIVASTASSAREILHSSAFSDRPIKQSAKELLFGRAIGFAPHGEYWRKLRRIAANHLFSPKRIAAHEASRQEDVRKMMEFIRSESVVSADGSVKIRTHLQHAALNNIMGSVFGRKYDFGLNNEASALKEMVREGFELLGAFNWADHISILESVDPQDISRRCAELVPKVVAFVQQIIDEHRARETPSAEVDFVDILLGMSGDDKLEDADMIAVLWEMIFRGTDTTAILTEWAMAELTINPNIQQKLREELNGLVGEGEELSDAIISRCTYLQAVVKETLRLHPPGPLLSWARLSTQDVTVEGFHVPKGTTAMVNMWAITHDPAVWEGPNEFRPERFVPREGGIDFDVKGSDLRLAPFGAGRRVCPGRALGMATVNLWVARLVREYVWTPSSRNPVNLGEVLRLSAEMIEPLRTCPVRVE